MRALCCLAIAVLCACGQVKDTPNDAAAPMDTSQTCRPDETMCGDTCVNTNNDPDHCGSCDPCALENATAGCVQGQCVVAECTAGFCDGDGVGGCEVQPDFQTDFDHCGSCNNQCLTGICSAGVCSRRAFISANTFPANFGGLTGADAICQSEAQSHQFGGIWKAWLADSTASPDTRFTKHGAFIRASDHVVIADDYADLTDGTLDNAVLKLADGTTPAIGSCWSNVTSTGVSAGTTNCANWTSTSSGLSGARGQHNLTSGSWTNSGSQNCDPNVLAPARLYCFEQ